jgi:ribosomal protein S18 acetylase RimI-like enzyme
VDALIRPYRPDDASAVRYCVVELQESERVLDPRLRPGQAIADDYCEQLHAQCREAEGRMFVAEQDGTVVGFVCVLAREPFTDLDDPPGTYAFVTDLIVLPPWRGHGIGRRLLESAETFARNAGAREFRIGVLSRNLTARRLYLANGFEPHLEIFAKRW